MIILKNILFQKHFETFCFKNISKHFDNIIINKFRMYYLAYLTMGRAKYEFETIIVGLFRDKNQACSKMADVLADGRLLFDDINEYYTRNINTYDADFYDDLLKVNGGNKKYTDIEIQDHKDMIKNITNQTVTEELLKKYVQKYNNGYHEEGWTYEIEEVDPI